MQTKDRMWRIFDQRSVIPGLILKRHLPLIKSKFCGYAERLSAFDNFMRNVLTRLNVLDAKMLLCFCELDVAVRCSDTHVAFLPWSYLHRDNLCVDLWDGRGNFLNVLLKLVLKLDLPHFLGVNYDKLVLVGSPAIWLEGVAVPLSHHKVVFCVLSSGKTTDSWSYFYPFFMF